MASNDSNDDSQPLDQQEPIVAKLADQGDAPRDEQTPANNPAEMPTQAISGLEGDDFGLTGDSSPVESTSTESPSDHSPRDHSPRDHSPDSDSGDDAIRTGSPFAVDPQSIAGTPIQVRRSRPEDFYDVGPLRYTAMGAVAAAALVLGFAATAAWWFPGGGTIIAALGCALSVFGLYSNKKAAASGCLLLHLLLFMISYSRAISA